MKFLIRYGEIGIKSRRVRSRFESKLIENIENAFLRCNKECVITREFGRIFVLADEESIEILSKIFGIVSLSPVIETDSELEEISRTTAEYSKSILEKGDSFAIRARRSGSQSFTSQDVAEHAGRAVLSANKGKEIKVDLTNPDKEIFIEVREKKAYIFSEIFEGVGGMPLGTQGKVVAFISDENSLIAVWMMMRRGCNAVFAFSKGMEGKERERLVKILEKWCHSFKIYHASSMPECIELARRLRADGLVSGLGIGQLPKQLKTELPVFYPLIGLEDEDVRRLRRVIGIV